MIHCGSRSKTIIRLKTFYVKGKQTMSLVQQYIAIIYHLVSNGKWSELIEFFALLREVLNTPIGVITVGIPTDMDE